MAPPTLCHQKHDSGEKQYFVPFSAPFLQLITVNIHCEGGHTRVWRHSSAQRSKMQCKGAAEGATTAHTHSSPFCVHFYRPPHVRLTCTHIHAM